MKGAGVVPSFFSLVRQSTCEVYPYWPRAAMLESAVFHLWPDHAQFRDYNVFREHILSAGNIADHERAYLFWSRVEEFPENICHIYNLRYIVFICCQRFKALFIKIYYMLI